MVSKIEAYKKILKLIDDDISKENISLDKSNVSSWIEVLEVCEEFGIPSPEQFSGYNQWFTVGNHWHDFMHMGFYSAKANRRILCSDNGKQPEGEWLLKIQFPTGAYIFGESYPEKTFDEFFKELITYKPKYKDSMNKELYFSKGTAKLVYSDFYNIFNKYLGMVKEEIKEQRKQELLKELEKLGG